MTLLVTTVSDKKKAIRSVADTTAIDHYGADVITATDYYPFGMLMPGRSKYASEIGEVKQVQSCTSCSMLQQLVNDYFSTLSSGVGSETAMISYMQGRLAADSLSYTTTEILSALNTCGNSWKKNIGFHADVSSFLSYETSPQVRFHKEDFSVGAWIYPEAESSSIQTIVTNHTFTGGVMAGYRLYMLNGQIYFQMGDPNYALTDSGCAQIRTVNKITSLEWHDVVAVRSGNSAANFKIYVDGVLQQTEVADYPAIRSAGGDIYNEYVGRYVVGNGSGSGNNVNLFLGFIKNLRVYNRPVSAAVVLNNYNNSCTGSVDTTGLVLWSKIDEGTSTTVIDYSRYQTNGALALDAFGGGVGRAVAAGCLTNDSLNVLCKARSVTGRKVSGYRYGFNGKENDNEIKGEGNSLDFGGRVYDSRVGRWLGVDPLFEKYPYASPYNYALNTPIQAKDPDGKVVIFINGLWGWPNKVGTGGTEDYWGANWVERTQNAIGDHKKPIYYDGSIGGTSRLFSTPFKTNSNISMQYRIDAGEAAGYNDAKSIIDKLDNDETIKIVTNSMGSAFERGFTKGLFKYVDEQTTSITSELLLLNKQKNSLEANIQTDRLKTLNLLSHPSKAETQLIGLNSKISALNSEKSKLQNAQVEMLIDLSSHQVDFPDRNANKRYFMMAGAKNMNTAESMFVQEKWVNFSQYLGEMSSHHSHGADPSKFPSAEKRDDNK